MSLATRCAACGTVFRVVQDQLRVSSGWVRCGRCGEVFNAIESLVDLELDRPGDGGSPSVHGSRVMDDLARVAGSRAAIRPSVDSADAAAPPPSQPVPGGAATPAEAGSVTATTDGGNSVGPDGDGGRADAGAVAGGFQGPAGVQVAGLPPALAQALPSAGGALVSESALPLPTFVRDANRAARWRSPGMRLALGVLAALASIGLLWQMHLSHHDWMAARWPVLAPSIERVCVWTGCSVEPPRRIEAFVVESSGLVRDDASRTYRLNLVLRNRDRWTLRLPAVDLVMTDARGDVLVRRVLDGPAIGAPTDRIEPGADLSLMARLHVQGPPVVGYTIELFYP